MTEPGPEQEDEALWRFSIISPLLHRAPDGLTLDEEMERIAQGGVLTPKGERKFLSKDTLRGWLSKYRALGLAGLKNKTRKDKHNTSVPKVLQNHLAWQRELNPLWTTERLLNALRDRSQWDGKTPSRSALYRFVTSRDLGRKPHRPNPTQARAFAYPNFGDLWTGDFLHGPKVKTGVKAVKTYLCAIIDDATRYIAAAGFHTAENTEALISELMLAVRRFGIPRRFYTDNGSAFRSRHLKTAAARLGMGLPHTSPGQPQGRGKIERWFRTLRDQFLTGKNVTTLKKLNQDLQQWITGYHQTPHAALKTSPLNRKVNDSGPPLKRIEPIKNIDAFFRMETYKTIQRDGCVRLFGKRYEIKDALPGQKIKIQYLPWNKSIVWAGDDMTPAKPVDLDQNANRFNNPKQKG